jgi:glycosyltransferase involved in cell wall biosynthesis
MGLRTASATTVQTGRTSEAWKLLVRSEAMNASLAVQRGDLDELQAVFGRIDGWDNPHRRYQALCQVADLVLAAGSELPSDMWWARLYLSTTERLIEALENEPSEPVLINALGVFLYELVELSGARACFEAARRLDPQLPHVGRNLEEVRRREKARAVSPLPSGVAARARMLSSRAAKLAKRAQPAQGLTLSLCMIVKDEEEMLPGCLEAIAPAVDEIIIVDTGSTDRTVEIAESFGATVISFPWNGSFSDARNTSLDRATSDWVVYLDADEHLFPEDAPLIRKLLGRTWREGFYLVETNYTGGDDSGHAVTHTALRLFRNRPEYRFEGRIHEQKTHAMPTFLPERFETTTIRLRHYGYLKGRLVSKDKSRRNIELLEQERREAVSPFNSFNLGSEHLALGDPAEARRYFDEAWVEIKKVDGFQNVPYVPLLVSRVVRARREARDLVAARAAIAEGLAMYQDHTDLVFEQALCAREEGDAESAAAFAESCLEMGDAPSQYAATVGSGSHLALTLLGDVRAAQGRGPEAEASYRKALEEHPDFVAPVLPLASLMLRRGASDAEAAAAIGDPRPSTVLMLATAYHEAGRHEAAEQGFRQVLDRQPGNGAARIGLAESLLSQRRYDEADHEAAAEPDDSAVRGSALIVRLFTAAVGGHDVRLGELLAEAEEHVAPEVREVYGAWRSAIVGEICRPLSERAAGPLGTTLEALLRVGEFDAFGQLAELLERTAVPPRDRNELLAGIYLRRGFLESAADEWMAVCRTAPDVPALIGLSQVAVAEGLLEDALAFAECSLELEPGNEAGTRLANGIRARLSSQAA